MLAGRCNSTDRVFRAARPRGPQAAEGEGQPYVCCKAGAYIHPPFYPCPQPARGTVIIETLPTATICIFVANLTSIIPMGIHCRTRAHTSLSYSCKHLQSYLSVLCCTCSSARRLRHTQMHYVLHESLMTLLCLHLIAVLRSPGQSACQSSASTPSTTPHAQSHTCPNSVCHSCRQRVLSFYLALACTQHAPYECRTHDTPSCRGIPPRLRLQAVLTPASILVGISPSLYVACPRSTALVQPHAPKPPHFLVSTPARLQP